MSLQEAGNLLQQLKTEYESASCDLGKCQSLLTKLKIMLTKFSFLNPSQQQKHADAEKELFISRETLEMACLISIKKKDLSAFKRHIAQVQTYYFDSGLKAEAMERKYKILGLNLMYLLSQGLYSEFHTELELIAFANQTNPYIKLAIEIEQYLMEGNYNKVLEERQDYPDFKFFMHLLADTVRDEIAGCIEDAYPAITFAEAQELLKFDNVALVKEFATKRNWNSSEDGFKFEVGKKQKEEIPANTLINRTLTYAKELERIV